MGQLREWFKIFMATINELNTQTDALSQQANALSSQLEDEVLGRAKVLIDDQVDFVKSIGLLSATLAPLSLLFLQAPVITSVINVKLLLCGFTVLVINIFFIYLCLRILLLKRSSENIKLLSLRSFEDIANIDGVKRMTQIDDAVDIVNHLLGIVTELQETLGGVENSQSRKRVTSSIKIREFMIWGSVGLLGLGIVLIILSMWGVALNIE